MRYFNKIENWGDALNLFLLRKLLPQMEVIGAGQHEAREKPHLLCIGSILHWATPHSIVWGTGAISSRHGPKHAPKALLAVRGPLTAKVVEAGGLRCPDRWLDPALLLPRFFRPGVGRTHKLGIVPHYVDEASAALSRLEGKGVKIIDVRWDIERYVRELCACEAVLSSSLHGLICADAYGIPSKWIILSEKVLGAGFKFRDYYLSQGRSEEPLEISGDESVASLAGKCAVGEEALDVDPALDALLGYFKDGGVATRSGD